MAKPAIAGEVHQPLDVHRGLAAKVAFDTVLGVDGLADLDDLLVGQVLDPALRRDLQGFGDVLGRGAADSVDVGKGDLDPFVGRDVDAGDSCHSASFCSSTGRLRPGRTPHLVASGPIPNEKPTRARMRRRVPVERDGWEIGSWTGGVKQTRAPAVQRLTLDIPLQPELQGAVVALGNFDGFHLGHQAVVNRAVALGHHRRRPVIVATFDPHPVRHFKPDAPPFRLTSLGQRERLFARAGADAMLVFDFNAELAATGAEDFVGTFLAQRIGASAVVTGEDFTFGRGRSGNAATLRELGAQHGILAEAVAPVLLQGEPVSSSRIREALAAGQPDIATRLLTRPFAIEGEVIHGDARGRDLGYPTANLDVGKYQRPAYGIYAVRVRLDEETEHAGVASFGIRPMFQPPVELLEAYLFDFDGDLYGRTIEVALHHYIRPEGKFSDNDALVRQMRKDESEARRLLSLPVQQSSSSRP